jgi:hypothetical protein
MFKKLQDKVSVPMKCIVFVYFFSLFNVKFFAVKLMFIQVWKIVWSVFNILMSL